MHTEVAVVLIKSLQGGDVGDPFDYLIHPLDGPHHLVAFLLSEDWRPLVFGDLGFERRRMQFSVTSLVLHEWHKVC